MSVWDKKGRPTNCPYCRGTFLRDALVPQEDRWGQPDGTAIVQIKCNHDSLPPEQDPAITQATRKW